MQSVVCVCVGVFNYVIHMFGKKTSDKISSGELLVMD